MVKEAGLSNSIQFDSCGTGGWHVGSPPDARMIEHARGRGYDISDLRARTIQAPDDFEKFDLILTMDNSNYRNVIGLEPTGKHHDKVKPMLSYCRVHQQVKEVPDPYYTGDDGFQYVIDLLEDSCEQLLKQLQREGP
jgi:protein-tyrosine phosphatase